MELEKALLAKLWNYLWFALAQILTWQGLCKLIDLGQLLLLNCFSANKSNTEDKLWLINTNS